MPTSGPSLSTGQQINPLYLASASPSHVSITNSPRTLRTSSSPSSSQRYLYGGGSHSNDSAYALSPGATALLHAHSPVRSSSRSLSLPFTTADIDAVTNSSASPSTAVSLSPKPNHEKLPPVMVIKLPDGSQVLGVTPEIAEEFDESMVTSSSSGSNSSVSSSSSSSRNLSPQQSAVAILNSLTPESHQMITTALTNANSLAELRELGFDLDEDGWLTLPNHDHVFLPQYLYAQEIALRTARRNAEFQGIRSYLVKATTLARYVRRLSFFHLGMAGLQILTTNFTGIFGIFASGGCFGARFGRIKVLMVYILYCLYVIGISLWTYLVWIKQSKNEGVDVVFGTGIMRLNAVLISIACFVSIVAIIVTIQLIIVLRQIYNKGYYVDQNRASNGQFALSRRRIRTPLGDTTNINTNSNYEPSSPTMLMNHLPFYNSLLMQRNRTEVNGSTTFTNPLTMRSPESSFTSFAPTSIVIDDNSSNRGSYNASDHR